jgi:hypothetical protein
MGQVMAATGRIEKLSDGLCQTDDIKAIMKKLVPFVAGDCAL